jgi:topoisomerase-4 subunit A
VLLLANSGGYGLLVRAGDLHSRQKAGKAFLTLEPGERLLPPAIVDPLHRQVACLSGDGRLLIFALDELKLQASGGRGLTLMDVDADTPLVSVATIASLLRITGQGRGGRAKDEDVRPAGLVPYVGRRARKGRKIEGFPKPQRLLPL